MVSITGGPSAVNRIKFESTPTFLPFNVTYTGSGLDKLTAAAVPGRTLVWTPNTLTGGVLRGVSNSAVADSTAITFSGVKDLVFAGNFVVNGGAANTLTSTTTGAGAGTLALDSTTITYSGAAAITLLSLQANAVVTTPASVAPETVASRISPLGLTLPAWFSGSTTLQALSASGVSLAFLAPTSSFTVNNVARSERTAPVGVSSGLSGGQFDLGNVMSGTQGKAGGVPGFTVASLLGSPISGLSISLAPGALFLDGSSLVSSSLGSYGATTSATALIGIPVTESPFTGKLRINGIFLGSPFTVEFDIVGTGVPLATAIDVPELTVVGDDLALGAVTIGTSRQFTFTIDNEIDFLIHDLTATLSGSSVYSISSAPAITLTATSGTTTGAVTLTAPMTIDSFTGLLTIKGKVIRNEFTAVFDVTGRSTAWALDVASKTLRLSPNYLPTIGNTLAHTLTINPDNSVTLTGTASDDFAATVGTVTTIEISGGTTHANSLSVVSASALPYNIVYTGGGLDTLTGPALGGGTVRWNVTGSGSGEARGAGGAATKAITFTGVKNLTGGAGSDNAFVFGPSGTISGAVTGVSGGSDQVILNGGSYQTLRYIASGPFAGSISREGLIFTYAGIEEIVSLALSGDIVVTTDGATAVAPLTASSFKEVSNRLGPVVISPLPSGVVSATKLTELIGTTPSLITAVYLRTASGSITLNGNSVPVPNSSLLDIGGLLGGIIDFGAVTMGESKSVPLTIGGLLGLIVGLSAAVTGGGPFSAGPLNPIDLVTSGLNLQMLPAVGPQTTFFSELTIGGSLLGNIFNIVIPIKGRSTAWDLNGTIASLATGFVGSVVGSLSHTLSFDEDGGFSLGTDLFELPGSVTEIDIVGSATSANVFSVISSGPLPVDLSFVGSGLPSVLGVGGDTLTGPGFSSGQGLWSITGAGTGSVTNLIGGSETGGALSFAGVSNLIGGAGGLGNIFSLEDALGFNGLLDGGLGGLSKLILNNASDPFGQLTFTAESATSGELSMASIPSLIQLLNISQLNVLTPDDGLGGVDVNFITTAVGPAGALMSTNVTDRGLSGLPIDLGGATDLLMLGGAGLPSLAFLDPTGLIHINGVVAALSALGLNSVGIKDLGVLGMTGGSGLGSFSLENILTSGISNVDVSLLSGNFNLLSPSFISSIGPGGITNIDLGLVTSGAVLGPITDTLLLEGDLFGVNDLLLAIPILATATGWVFNSGILSLDSGVLGALQGDSLNHVLDLSGGQVGLGGLLSGGSFFNDLLSGVAFGDITKIVLQGASGLSANSNFLEIITGGLSELPFDIEFIGNTVGGDTLVGPDIVGKTMLWDVSGIGASNLTSMIPGANPEDAPDEDPFGVLFSGVSSLIGAAGTDNTFNLTSFGGLTDIDGGLGGLSNLVLNPLSSLGDLGLDLNSLLDGVLSLASGLLNLLNLSQIISLAPPEDILIEGLVNLPDIFLMTSTNLDGILGGLGISLPVDLPDLILVGGTNASIPNIVFAPPTNSLRIDGRGGLDIVAVVGSIVAPGADIEIDAAIIAVLGLSTEALSQIPTLATIVPLAPLVPLLNVLAVLPPLGSPVGNGAGIPTTTQIDTLCNGECAPGGTDGTIKLNATAIGLIEQLKQLTGSLPTTGGVFNLVPVELATAVAIVVGARLAGASVEVTALSDAEPANPTTPLIQASLATSIAQVIVLASTIEASTGGITLAAESKIDGTVGLVPPIVGPPALLAAVVGVSVAGATVALSRLTASNGPVEVTATNTVDLETTVNGTVGSIVGAAVAIAVVTQITLATVTGSTVNAASFLLAADSGGDVETNAIAAPNGSSSNNPDLLTGAVNALVGTVVSAVTGVLGGIGAGGVAASLAVTGLLQVTDALLVGADLTTTGAQTVRAHSNTAVSTNANAETGAGSGLAVGVAISLPVVQTAALVTGVNSSGSVLSIEADSDGIYETNSLSGAGATDLGGGIKVGLAGSIAVGIT